MCLWRTHFTIMFVTLTLAVSAQTIRLEGIVTDADGEALEGITVQVDRSTQGTFTSSQGLFTIADLVPGSYHLLVSGVGYQTLRLPLALGQEPTQRLTVRLQEGTTQIEEVVVRGKSEAAIVRQQAYPVAAIETRPLANRNLDMNQLLTRTAGVRVRESGGLGSNFRYTINGLSGNAIRFFVDGIPIERFGAGYSINNFPVNLVERVEIYKGALPIELGTDALGGAVNLVTKQGFNNYLDASYSYGSFNTHRLALNGYWHHCQQLFLEASAFHNNTDNDYEVWGKGVEVADPQTGRAREIRTERFHDAYRSTSFTVAGGIKDQGWADLLKAGAVYADSYNEVQHGATMATVFGEAIRKDASLSPFVQFQKSDLLARGLDVTLYGSYSDLQSTVVDTSARKYDWSGKVVSIHPNNSELGSGRNGQSLLSLQSLNFYGQGQVSYQYHPQHRWHVSYTLDDWERDGQDPFASDRAVAFTTPQELTKHMAALAYELKLLDEKVTQHLWVEHYDFHARAADEQYVNDSLGYRPVAVLIEENINYTGYGYALKYQLNAQNLLKLSAERTIRLPDADEILGDGLFVKSNAFLRPENSVNLNASWLGSVSLAQNHRLSFEPSFFYRNTQDLILYIVNEGRGVGTHRNIGKVRGLGGSIDLQYAYRDLLRLQTNATYQDLRDWQEFEGPNRNQTYRNRLRNTPYLMANASLTVRHRDLLTQSDQLDFFWDTQYVHAFFLTWPGLGAQNKPTIPSQLVNSVGVTYGWQSNRYNLSLECRNLLDEQVYDNYLLQKPGRAFSIKTRIFLQ